MVDAKRVHASLTGEAATRFIDAVVESLPEAKGQDFNLYFYCYEENGARECLMIDAQIGQAEWRDLQRDQDSVRVLKLLMKPESTRQIGEIIDEAYGMRGVRLSAECKVVSGPRKCELAKLHR